MRHRIIGSDHRRERMRSMKITQKIWLFPLLLVLMSGCVENQQLNAERDAFDADKHDELKIAYVNASMFERRYAQLLQDQFPNIDVVILDDGFLQSSDLGQWMEQHQPDLVFISKLEDYQDLVARGFLVDLESLMENDGFDLEPYIPEILDVLRNNDQHRLYGLSTHFSNDALFYNQSIFNQAGVAYPTSPLTWHDVIDLAQQIKSRASVDSDVIGFLNRFQSPGSLLLAWGESEGLTYVSEVGDAPQVTLNTEAWKNIWHELIHAYQAGLITDETESVFFPPHAAMYVGNFLDYRQLFNHKMEQDWGVVHYPVSVYQDNHNSRFNLTAIMAISSASPNQAVAWELVKYLSSDEVAQLEMNSPLEFGFSTRDQWNLGNDRVTAEVFYPAQDDAMRETIRASYRSITLKHANRLINEVLQDNLDVDTALTLWQKDVESEILNK